MTRRMLATLLLPATMLVTGCGYNTIQQLDETAQQSQKNIQVQLQRRLDLVPNLVKTVQRFAQQEKDVFVGVADARAKLAGAVQSGDASQMAQANAGLSSQLGRLLVISEAYPQLKSDQGFLKLQDELTGTENRLSTARTDYNEAVAKYNSYIRSFPQAVTAKVVGAKPRVYFEAAAEAQTAPSVNFDAPPAPGGAPPPASAPAPAQ